MNIEIERKFLIDIIPYDLNKYSYDNIMQGYISVSPVIRIRKVNNKYFLTCKSKGLKVRQEFEIEINKNEFENLKNKIDYSLIYKKRYFIPIDNNLKIELDVFEGNLKGLVIAEIEFKTLEESNNFNPPSWFIKEVTYDKKYQNNNLCKVKNFNELLSH